MRQGLKIACAIAITAFTVTTSIRAQNLTGVQLLRSRAVETVIWGMSAVNTDLMRQEMLTKTTGKVNHFIYCGRPLDYHNQTLTPNPDTLYFMAFFNTKDVGPIVLEVPPGDANGSLNGNIVTVWQTSLEDVGLLGIDKGAGGKFVILPPGYKDKAPDGYTALPSGTYSGYALVRSNRKATVMLMLQHRSPMRSERSCIRCPPRPIRLKQSSPT